MASSVEAHHIQRKVRAKLEKDVRTRDNDALLCALIWWDELKDFGITTAQAFLAEYSHGKKFTNAESIRRSRQKLQQDNVELRGGAYAKRKEKEQTFLNELNKQQ